MKVLITQSCYIPWRGFFAAMRDANLVVLYDTVQYTSRDWRNRNLIRQGEGVGWLTIPVHGSQSMAINEVTVSDPQWSTRHLRTLEHTYAQNRAPEALAAIRALYARVADTAHLSQINHALLQGLCELLQIPTPIARAESFAHQGSPSERLAQIAEQTGAHIYLTGPAARAYLDEAPFTAHGIAVEYLDYSHLPTPPAAGAPNLSIVHDLLTVGRAAAKQGAKFHTPTDNLMDAAVPWQDAGNDE